MKIIVQRVKEASCIVNNSLISKISNGYLLFVGLTHSDTIEDVKYLAKRVAKLRIFEDETNKLNKSILDMNYEILSISQFTLYANTKKGNRPSFTDAMEPLLAEKLYLDLTHILNNEYNIKTYNGVFGEYMDISLVNDGPVTILLESK
jgi:D-tyrosyl-tRNA(Tyr) deacylase